ncbi:MAG: DNA polymerase III subunit gamma/tau [Ruminococcus sp.]|nr:DNA polymerase III subunit gamma/tau [Ruminococcus sp.]
MYQVLYRKWRPKTFEDVSGQPQVTRTLQNEIKAGRINHAYLFTGSRGTGKTTCAKIFAKAVNCLNPVDGNPCGECENCKTIENGDMHDVVEMDAASNRGIDDIRDIIDKARFSPAKAKYRVYIVDEVHMLTEQAFNALLKTLEEPPEHVIFILATTEVHKLPATIVSRCQRFDFHRIASDAISDRLKYVAENENVTITDDAALLISAVADGALRDALSLLDRCIALDNNITADVVRKASGLAKKDYLFDLANCCINKNTPKALEIVDRLYNEAKDMARLCNELIDHFRNLMIIKSVKNPKEFLVMSEDEFDNAQTQADFLTLEEIVYIMDVLEQSYQRMGKGSSNRTEFETALVKLSAPELDFSMEALLSRISALENAVKKGIRVVNSEEKQPPKAEEKPIEDNKTSKTETSEPDFEEPAKKADSSEIENILNPKPVQSFSEPAENITPQPQVVQSPVRKQVDYEEIYNNATPFLQWPEVVEHLKKYSKTIATSFTNTNAYESGNYLLIDANSTMPFELLKVSTQREKIREAIMEITGKKFNLGPYKKPEKKQEEVKDPLDTFTEQLKNSGIEITEE